MSAFVLDDALVASAARALAPRLAAPRPAAPIAVLAGNVPQIVVARDAATLANRPLVPVNPALATPEIAYLLRDSRASILLVEPALASAAQAAVATLPATVQPVLEVLPWPPDVGRSGCDDAPGYGSTIIYTSGTTGRPKGCVRTAAQEQARGRELIATYGISSRDVHLIACPLAHSAPGIFLRAARSVGAKTVILPRFDPEAFLAAVASHCATLFFLVPTQYRRLLALPAATRTRFDLSSIRVAIVAGAPITAATKLQLISWLGEDILWEFYGSSETGTIAVLPPAQQRLRPSSVGKPPPGTSVRLENLREGLGEIFVRSPAVMEGYLSGQAEVRDGHVSVGDLGRFDDEGYLYLVDRKHDTIISGGVNVYPAEVERALLEHPAIASAVVFGADDSDWGQIVCAVLVGDDALDFNDVRQFLRAHLAAAKLPKAFARITAAELPLGGSGKPLRRQARARFSKRLVRIAR